MVSMRDENVAGTVAMSNMHRPVNAAIRTRRVVRAPANATQHSTHITGRTNKYVHYHHLPLLECLPDARIPLKREQRVAQQVRTLSVCIRGLEEYPTHDRYVSYATVILQGT